MKAIIRICTVLGALIAADACAQVGITVPETGRVKRGPYFQKDHIWA